MTKTPSKHISLYRLKMIKQDNCVTITDEYTELEVDLAIINRSENIARKLENKAAKIESQKIAPNDYVHPIELFKADFKLKIEDIKQRQNLSYSDIAKSAGITRQALHNIISGKTPPSFSVIMKLVERYKFKITLG